MLRVGFDTTLEKMPELGPISDLLLRFSPDALIVVDDHGIIRFANEPACALFGFSQVELVGKSMDCLVPRRFRSRHEAHVSNYLRVPTNREMGAGLSDLFAVRADGSEFPVGIRLAPVKHGDGSYVAASIRDTTEQRSISDALIAAREETDRANRAKSRFLATVTRNLRQPLQATRMINAAMQKLTEALPQLNELLVQQQTAIDGASGLLSALLDISRLESGAVEPILAPLPLRAVFTELRQQFEAVALGRHLVINFPESHTVIRSDRILLLQLLQNLVGNALKYTERGDVRVVETVESDALILSVEDSGIGITKEKLDRIFDECYQLSREGTQRLGVGLGLAIVREVARILGYSVAVFSAVGKGTQVRVRIPIEALVNDRAPVERMVAVAPPSPNKLRCRIVLLEDNDSVRNATELFLSLAGYETQSAASESDAMELLAQMQPGDILIADYHLGGTVTGLDVLRQLRAQQECDVPAVLLSGDLQSMMRVVKDPIPRIRFLSKPVDTKALLQAISELSIAL
jgi:two-component system, sensor histidine kinase